MAKQLLPDAFADLEPYVDWALPTERARNSKRLSSSMEQINEFYGKIFPRMEAVIAHLNGFSLDKMPEKEKRLLDMAFSLAEVANAVELFHQPGVIDGFPPERFLPMHE